MPPRPSPRRSRVWPRSIWSSAMPKRWSLPPGRGSAPISWARPSGFRSTTSCR
ncbi:hypothetical protein RB2654_14450 [Rhodobacterales bacterium HTCC2654]|uniref:Uncharacterized protein n=1 Tax=Maritimibacter alkaliphilus HTCC2654 TaxID=314271 RepID=A3VGT9_9RHOB|nr:hypothetical protein RB2654_14450 [Rhodobacterales bacterium HTCC2654] [Maritimibacter alkaliphilus HTCC2654]